ncbi:MAG: hypothetical protein OEX19_01235 [Gammaproteobacteria bacterium]|nr:hypothetical protein [Gammaproteobacteria bacterium]
MLYRRFSGLYQPILVIAVLFLALSCIACSSTPLKLEHTPTRESDFQLPPEELKAKFADVEGLHPLTAREYVAKDSRKTDPMTEDLIEYFGEPDQKRLIPKDPLWVLANPVGTLGAVSFVSTPLVGGIFLGLAGTGHIFSPPPGELTWQKGDYTILARTYQNYERMLYWEWSHKTNDSTGTLTPIVDHVQKSTFWQWTGSLPMYIATKNDNYEHSYWGIGYGRSFHPKGIIDNVHIDALNSVQSFIRNAVAVIGVTHFVSALSATKDFNLQKNEIGLGLWYDTSLYDAFNNAYKGKIGAFAEIGFVKTHITEHVLRIGYVRFLQDGISNRQHFGRVQLITRFRGMK